MAKHGNTQRKHTLVVLAENKLGLLARVSALLSGRGYQIETLAIGPAFDSSMARMTIVVVADDFEVEQLLKQLRKLIDVIRVSDLSDATCIEREALLVTVKPAASGRDEVLRIASVFQAKIVDMTPRTYTLEAIGETSRIAALIDALRPFRVQELVRSGTVAMARPSTLHALSRRPGDGIGLTKRRFLRRPLRLEVRLASVDQLMKLWTFDISSGGMSIETEQEIDVGARVQVRLIHPANGEIFPIQAIVRRRIVQPHFRGLGIEFVDLDEGMRKELGEFIQGESDVLSEPDAEPVAEADSE
jgi:acetolactate synthase I/III small subunit